MRKMDHVGRVAFGAVIVIWSLGPIYWALNIALTSPLGLVAPRAALIPDPPYFGQFAALLDPASPIGLAFFSALLNSVVQSLGATIVTVLVALFSGYAFARWSFRGSRLLFLLVVGGLSLPLLAVLVPLLKWTSVLGLIDTDPPIILFAVSASLPLGVWIMRSFASALPRDIEDAARIDGASELKVLWHVVLPLLAPAVVAVGIIVFLTTWSSFLVPVFFTQTAASQPLTVFIANLANKQSANVGQQAAAACLAIVIPILAVVGLNKYLVGGLLRGAMK